MLESNQGLVGQCKCDKGYYEAANEGKCILCLDSIPYCKICKNETTCLQCINNLIWNVAN